MKSKNEVSSAKNQNGSEDLAIPAPETASGIAIPELVTADMVRTPDPGKAGEYPFTRGVFPDGFRGRLWTFRQYSGFGTAEDSNQRYKFLLQQGQTGLSIQNDILKEYVARRTWIFPVKPSMRLISDTILYSNDVTPRFNPISIAGAHVRDAGATAVEELGRTHPAAVP